jgi:hypothetical protein
MTPDPNYRNRHQLLDEIERLRGMVNAPLGPDEFRLIDKHCDWIAFGHAWNAIMKHRRAALEPKP